MNTSTPLAPAFDLGCHALRDFVGNEALWPSRPQRMGAHTSSCGLEAFASRSEYTETTDITMCDSAERLHLSVWLRDGIDVLADQRKLRVEGRDTVAGFLPGVPWHTRFRGHAYHVGLLLRHEVLESLAGESGAEFFRRLHRDGGLRIAAADAELLHAAQALEAALLAPAASHLLREARSLELLAHFVSSAVNASGAVRISRRDHERLMHARELLLADIAQAPTLAQLSQACGLNTLKLKQGFKELFGLPVHALYQRERMRSAWDVIASGRMTATEAGAHVGYANMSHFSAAFRQAFGMLPSELKRRATSARPTLSS